MKTAIETANHNCKKFASFIPASKNTGVFKSNEIIGVVKSAVLIICLKTWFSKSGMKLNYLLSGNFRENI